MTITTPGIVKGAQLKEFDWRNVCNRTFAVFASKIHLSLLNIPLHTRSSQWTGLKHCLVMRQLRRNNAGLGSESDSSSRAMVVRHSERSRHNKVLDLNSSSLSYQPFTVTRVLFQQCRIYKKQQVLDSRRRPTLEFINRCPST